MDKITQLAIKNAGGVTALAAALGLTKQAVSQWKRVPANRVLKVAKLASLSPEALRPDVFK